MADIQLKNLNEITNTSQLTSTKNLLIFDNSTNAGNRISLTTLANSISDQTITGLAGTNQSLKTAVNTLNSNIVNTPITNTVKYSGDNTVFDTLHANATDGTYYKTGAAFSSVHPVLGGSSGILFGYRTNTLYGWQRFKSSSKEATRKLINGTWSEWVNQPTRAEVDTLNSKMITMPIFVPQLYASTTKDAIDTDLRAKTGNNSQYVAFCILYQMTDGTDGGYYLVWRNTNMSVNTKFIKLG